MKTALKLTLLLGLILCQLTALSTPYTPDTLTPSQQQEVIGWLPRIEKDLKECDYLRQRVGYLESSLQLSRKLVLNAETTTAAAQSENALLQSRLYTQKRRTRIWVAVALGTAAYIFREPILNLVTR